MALKVKCRGRENYDRMVNGKWRGGMHVYDRLMA